VWIFTVKNERLPPPQRLVGPDLIEGRKKGLDLLCEFGRVGDLALVEVLVLEAAVKAFDHTVGVRRVVAGADVLEVGTRDGEAPEGVALEGGAVEFLSPVNR